MAEWSKASDFFRSFGLVDLDCWGVKYLFFHSFLMIFVIFLLIYDKRRSRYQVRFAKKKLLENVWKSNCNFHTNATAASRLNCQVFILNRQSIKDKQSTWLTLLWKFHNFSATDTLYEINFHHFEAQKIAILTISVALNFETLGIFVIF